MSIPPAYQTRQKWVAKTSLLPPWNRAQEVAKLLWNEHADTQAATNPSSNKPKRYLPLANRKGTTLRHVRACGDWTRRQTADCFSWSTASYPHRCVPHSQATRSVAEHNTITLGTKGGLRFKTILTSPVKNWAGQTKSVWMSVICLVKSKAWGNTVF